MASDRPSRSVRRPSTVQSGAATGSAAAEPAAARTNTAARTARRTMPEATMCRTGRNERERSRFAALEGWRHGACSIAPAGRARHRSPPAGRERRCTGTPGGLLHRPLVGRQVGAFEHDRVDLGVPSDQVARRGHDLALDRGAIERQAIAMNVGRRRRPRAGRRPACRPAHPPRRNEPPSGCRRGGDDADAAGPAAAGSAAAPRSPPAPATSAARSSW